MHAAYGLFACHCTHTIIQAHGGITYATYRITHATYRITYATYRITYALSQGAASDSQA